MFLKLCATKGQKHNRKFSASYALVGSKDAT